MLKERIARNVSPRHVALAAVFTVALAGAGSAEAQQIHTLPGSSCQASGSAQDLYYSGVSVANRGNNTRSAVCPVERHSPTDPWQLIAVFVRDRHSSQNISCVAQARDLYGVAGSGWSETQSTSGEGDQMLSFNAPGAAIPDYGPYVVVCSLPPMEEVNQPSYISSVAIVEP